MLRILLEVLVPFVAPFLVFFVWRLLVTRERAFLERTPWYILTLAGFVLAAASVVSLAFLTGSPPDEVYLPPHMEDGKVVPGRFVPAPSRP
jgi:hypothetical protein